GNPVAPYKAIKTEGREKRQHANQKDRATVRQRSAQQLEIAHFDRMQESFRGVRLLFALPQFQKARTHHGRQGKRHQQGHHDGHGYGPAKRIHILARIAGHERDRQKNNHQRKRGGHDREADFFGGLNRGLDVVFSLLLHVAKNVFENDDGIVDDDSDGQRERQQRHIVQRKIHTTHQRERSNDRRRNSYRCDQHRAPVANEQPHNEAGENAAQNQIFDQRMDRRLDEVGNVMNDLQLHA